MRQDDGPLIQSILDGNTEAFGELVTRYKGLVYALAFDSLRNFSDAQDVAQDVFIKAYRKLDQLENHSLLVPWLKTIVSRECQNLITRRKGVTPAGDAELVSSMEREPTDGWRAHESHSEMLEAVQSLPEDYRIVITLFYLSGMSCQEISATTGASVATIQQRLHKARKRLRVELLEDIESGLPKERLPATFAETVVRRLTIYPVDYGRCFHIDDGKAHAIVLGANTRPGKTPQLFALAMRIEDIIAISAITATSPIPAAATSKARSVEMCISILDALGVEPKQLHLFLDGQDQCRAKLEVTVSATGEEKSMILLPSDSILLAMKRHIPISVEQAIVDAGSVGEDGLHAEVSSLSDLPEQIKCTNGSVDLMDRLEHAGMFAEATRTILRLRRDSRADTLAVLNAGSGTPTMVLDAGAYAALWRYVESMTSEHKLIYGADSGYAYDVSLSMEDGDMLIHTKLRDADTSAE